MRAEYKLKCDFLLQKERKGDDKRNLWLLRGGGGWEVTSDICPNYHRRKSPVRYESTTINDCDVVLATRYRVRYPYRAI